MEDKPIIKITAPEVTTSEAENSLVKMDIYNYENSHVIYKGCDLGSFKELVKLKQKADRTEKAIEYIDKEVRFVNMQEYHNLIKILKGSDK